VLDINKCAGHEVSSTSKRQALLQVR
jgi:hypothetical protein